MLDTSISKSEMNEAKQHIFIALDEMRHDLPNDHPTLIEKMRDYFESQKVEVFSKIVQASGEEGLRKFIDDVVIESGFYVRDKGGSITVKK
jgi:hypothetical protein